MHGDDVGPRLTDGRFGQYQRLTQPGTFTVEVSCRDFLSETRSVQVGPSSWTVADFVLHSTATAVVDADDDARHWLQSRNPVQGGEQVRLALPTDARSFRVELYDLRGRHLAELGRDLAGGEAHLLRVPRGLADGVYLLRARAGNRQTVHRIVVVN